ncbi:MAG: KamA family radical SAM protein [Planctomycetes bacterium]|nr:KamA family radical SAM protein [Planctomycetota bacterium]
MLDKKVKYITQAEQLKQLSKEEQAAIKEVTERFSFRSNDYYLSLINWNDSEDPIRRIIIPHVCELEEWGQLDPSDEASYTIIPGLEHKYNSTALLLVSDICEGICRYCFRKRVFIESHEEHRLNLPAALEYIKEHTEINNILLTGGDPLVLATSKLEAIIRQLREIDHVNIIRIGTKMPAFNPHRIVDDPALLEMVSTYSTEKKKIYFMTHFVHPRELTDLAIESVHLLQKAGGQICNQTPLIRGVNDKAEVLAELLAKLSFIGAAPYYIFQCRPASGNKAYTVPIEEGYEIVEQAKARVSGLAKRVKFVMSHTSGKIEIVGKTEDFVYFKYHRAADDEDSGRFLSFKSNPEACWFDDYDEAIQEKSNRPAT